MQIQTVNVCEVLEPYTGLKQDLAQSKSSMNVIVFIVSHSNSSINGGNKVFFKPKKGKKLTLSESLPETLHALFNIHSKS